MKLFIDTTDREKLALVLFKGKREVDRVEKKVSKHSERLLLELEKFLRVNKVKLKALKKISVNPGPGGFSSVRTGVAVANALNFALGLSEKAVLPKYNKPPHITKQKI